LSHFIGEAGPNKNRYVWLKMAEEKGAPQAKILSKCSVLVKNFAANP